MRQMKKVIMMLVDLQLFATQTTALAASGNC